MKYLFTIFSFFIISTFATSQTTKYYPQSVHVDKKHGYCDFIFEYDHKGNMLTNFYDEYINGYLFAKDHNTKTYDYQSRISTEEFDRFYFNGVEMIESRGKHLYAYNEENKIDTIFLEEYYPGDSVSFKYTSFAYNSEGAKTEEFVKVEIAETWQNESRISYNYDINGNEMKVTKEIWGNSAWKKTEEYSKIYDSSGNMTEYLSSGLNNLNEFTQKTKELSPIIHDILTKYITTNSFSCLHISRILSICIALKSNVAIGYKNNDE